MEFTREKEKVVVYDNNEELAVIEYSYIDSNTIEITHTFVSDKLRGQGVASKLMEEVISIANENKLRIVPICSYAKSYFNKHIEYEYLLK